MRARPLTPRLAAGLFVLSAALVLLAAPGAARAQAVLALTIESAAEGGARGLVIPGQRVAGAVLWPGPETIESEGMPPGTLAVAAQAALDAVVAGAPGARPLLEFGPGFVALGVELPQQDEARLFGLLARLATPQTPPPAAVGAAAAALRQRREELWSDPLERARLAALGLVFPGARGPWNVTGTPAALDRVSHASVTAVLGAVRGARVELRVAGPAGLASRSAVALSNRVGRLDPQPPPESDALPTAAVVPLPGGEGEEAAIVIGFRLYPEVAPAAGPPLAVLLEALSEGQGSLPQRLRVASNGGVHSIIEVVPSAGGGGVLLLGARTVREGAATAWRVLDGVVSSVRSLPLSSAAVYRARQRLNEQANYRAADAHAALTGFVRRQPWSWPPEGERDFSAADLREAARVVLHPDRRVTVAAGALPDDLAAAAPLREATRIEWERFDPFAEGLTNAVRETPGRSHGVEAAQMILSRMADDPAALANGFLARYRVTESTPLGDAETELRLDAGPGSTVIDVTGRRWSVRARGGDEGAEAELPGAEGALPLPEPERLPAQVYRQPVLLAAAGAAGTLPVTLSQANFDTTPVEALRAELPEGTVFMLLFAPGTRQPARMQIWYLGRDPSRPPDEEIRYLDWTTVAGVRVASEFTITDPLGAVRRFRLLDWTFKPPSL